MSNLKRSTRQLIANAQGNTRLFSKNPYSPAGKGTTQGARNSKASLIRKLRKIGGGRGANSIQAGLKKK